MAGNAYVYKRYWNPPKNCIIGDSDGVLHLDKRYTDGKKSPFMEVFWVGATQAGEELGTAADSVKDGRTTPFQLTVVSASANDTDAAAGHARKVAIIGCSLANSERPYYALGTSNSQYIAPKLTVEVINLSGATDVTSVRWYTAVSHAYVCDHGSGGADAAGAITIESPADTDLLTIAQNYNESNSGIFYFPANYRVKLDMMRINPADATVAAADGAMLTINSTGFEHLYNTDPDYADDYYYAMAPNDVQIEKNAWPRYRRTENSAAIKFTETTVANSQTYKIHCTLKVRSDT